MGSDFAVSIAEDCSAWVVEGASVGVSLLPQAKYRVEQMAENSTGLIFFKNIFLKKGWKIMGCV